MSETRAKMRAGAVGIVSLFLLLIVAKGNVPESLLALISMVGSLATGHACEREGGDFWDRLGGYGVYLLVGVGLLQFILLLWGEVP